MAEGAGPDPALPATVFPMSFLSPEFAFVALVFFPLYWALNGHRVAQQALLGVASYLLYATWSVDGAIVLLAYAVGIWGAGEILNRAGGHAPRRLMLAIGLAASLAVLLATKYYEFLRQTLVEMLPAMGLDALLPVLDLVAPVGISFYTFQAVTYLVWRYRSPRCYFGPLRPLVFLSFWPTLFAGPILRAEQFFPQMDESRGLPMDVRRAVLIIFLGLVEKLVFSNWLAETFVDSAFRYPDQLDAVGALCAIWGYSLQIFLDFAGYSLIVTGLALLLGYRVPVNFRQPYLARNLREFWQRWHISLSSFIRDYIYIPLGGNRLGFRRTQANVLAAMVVSGVWHGASPTFLVWGLFHGLGVVAVNLFDRFVGRPLAPLAARLLTLAGVGLAWVFFRAPTLESAQQMLCALSVMPTAVSPAAFSLAGFSILFFALSQRADALLLWAEARLEAWAGWRLFAAGSVAAYALVFFGPSGVPAFIYYRF